MNLQSRTYLTAILRWLLDVLSSMMSLLRLPIALLMSWLLLAWLYDYSITAATPALCGFPFASYMQSCQPTLTSLDPVFFQDGLSYSSKLEEMQRMGANSVELPYYLRIGEGSVRSMIIQLSATDLPTK